MAESEWTFSKNQKISTTIGAFMAVIVAVVLVDRRLGAIENQLQVIQVKQESNALDRWRSDNQKAWATELQRLNPDVIVPNPASKTLDPFMRPWMTGPPGG